MYCHLYCICVFLFLFFLPGCVSFICYLWLYIYINSDGTSYGCYLLISTLVSLSLSFCHCICLSLTHTLTSGKAGSRGVLTQICTAQSKWLQLKISWCIFSPSSKYKSLLFLRICKLLRTSSCVFPGLHVLWYLGVMFS